MEKRIRKTLSIAYDFQTAVDARLDNLGGHASLRIYWRIESDDFLFKDEKSLIAMVLPQDENAMKSDEASSSQDPIPEELPFVLVQKYLKEIGVRVPEIIYSDNEMDVGVYLLEDLGHTMFENRILNEPENIENLYQEAIDLLVDFQNKSMQGTRDCICWKKAFDKELLKWELDHYIEWGVDAIKEGDFFEGIREEISDRFDKLVNELVALPQALVFRDYQSRNIMWKNNEWVAIDFQDALTGPYIYDLVALLRDSYVELQPDMVNRLVDYYASQSLPWELKREDIHRAFHQQTLQRKLKDTGRFVFIDQVKGNDSFLQYYDPSLAYVKNALEHLPLHEDAVWNKIVQNG